jgi:hypothetical protein
MGRAKPHELAARIGHFEQGTERGLRRLKLELSLGLRRCAEKEERKHYSGTDAYQHIGPLQAIFLLLAIFLQNGLLLQKFRHAQLAATTIGWDAGLATGEP